MVKSPSYFVLEVNFYHQGQKKMVLDTLQIIKIICQCYINTGNIFISIKVLSLRSDESIACILCINIFVLFCI